MKKEVLKIENLEISYGQKKILDGLSLSVDKGEFVGIIGPNGTGKSTLVKAITNIIDYNKGSILVKDKLSNKISRKELAKMVAVVPQEFNIDYEFSNYDIVMMGRNPHINRKNKIGRKDYEIIKEAMKMTNTWQFKDNMFNELSGGERQRVIVARAIAQQSDIILLDEPTSHLDIHHQLEVMELIHILKEKRGTTVVAVLHDVNMAARFSDRLILLNKGHVVAEGPPEKVIKEDNLSKLYSMQMIVRDNKILGKREIIPLRVIKDKEEKIDGVKVHVISGGGTGEEILERLNSLGFSVTAGILNRGDSDWEICNILGIPCVEAPPFSNFSEVESEKNAQFIEKTDCILVTNVPYGNGNLKNLEILLSIEKPIYFLNDFENFDYTEGKATKLLKQLSAKENFHYINSYEQFIKTINKVAKK